MINRKVLEALEQTDISIKEELKKESIGGFSNEKEHLREARDKVQEAITYILKSG